MTAVRTLQFAVIGNPNTGKSTLFSALTGLHVRTGNFPGVTVEKKVGTLQVEGRELTLIDLPGTYSLSPRSPDERVSVDVLTNAQGDVGTIDGIICIVDASNIERNLYLFSQLTDLGLPILLVLNMMDVARKKGVTIELPELSRRLGVSVVTCEAVRKRGLDDVRKAIVTLAESSEVPPAPAFPEAVTTAVAALSSELPAHGITLPPAVVQRLLLDTDGQIERDLAERWTGLPAKLAELRSQVQAAGIRLASIEMKVRYAAIRQALAGVATPPAREKNSFTERVDSILTHRIAGLLIFVVLMYSLFKVLFQGAAPAMEGIEALFGLLQDAVRNLMDRGALRSLIVEGVIGGVGGVLVFLPQILLLFLFIAVLEDCGYMARAAFLMDRLMTRVGLSGKSFVPLMSSFACAIPGIMGTRTIENRRDRLVTILVAPLMSCSARLPVYLLLIYTFIPERNVVGSWIKLQELVLFGSLILGALVAIPVAWILKKTILKGETPPFVMELPPYKWPAPGVVVRRVFDAGWSFIKRAGTLILLTSIIVWGLCYFPGNHKESDRLAAEVDAEAEVQQPALEERGKLDERVAEKEAAGAEIDQPLQAEIDTNNAVLKKYDDLTDALHEEDGHLLEQSFLGRFGHVIEPAVKPLGWDWRIGVGALASFPAREVIIASLGIIYNLGSDVDEESSSLKDRLRAAAWPDGRPVFTIPTTLSILVFFALCAQCAATLMVLKQEAGGWKWALFSFTYMTTLAYIGALITYQLTTAMGL